MTRTSGQAVPWVFHPLAIAYVAGCLLLAWQHPAAYEATMQEDRFVEWASVFAFGAAGVVALRHAIPRRRLFDILVGVFFLFVAGEEMSWGQRLFGFTPPELFLAHNAQQEMNVHNFADIFGKPKWSLIMVLLGYSVALPLANSFAVGRRLLETIGATPPPAATIPWFLAAIVLLVWYPFSFTGEWTETLAGFTFLVAAGASGRTLAVLLAGGIVFSGALTAYSARGSTEPAQIACARAEAAALARLAERDLVEGRRPHKRVWTLVLDARLDSAAVRSALDSVSCAADAGVRRRFAVDPWGTAYWLRVPGDPDPMVVYSFGPNRRRDSDEFGNNAGDDILVPAR